MTSGWIIIDKPEGMTSTQVVTKLKYVLLRVTGQKIKVGHTGTLDPFATGLLPIAVGEATKLAQFLSDHKKSYQFEMIWGETRDTGDITGQTSEIFPFIPTPKDIETLLPEFLGNILQIPHRYSAIRVEGRRAYDMARANEDFVLKARSVTIESLKLLSHEGNKSVLEVTCSKGTYIRVLAEDMARRLGTGAFVSKLRRTQIGLFSQNHLVTLDKSDQILYESMFAMEAALDGILALAFSDVQMQAFGFGRVVPWRETYPDTENFPIFHNGKVKGIGSFKHGAIYSKRLLNI